MKSLAKLCFDREDYWLFGKDVLFLNDSFSWNLTLILFCNSLSSCLWKHITILAVNTWNFDFSLELGLGVRKLWLSKVIPLQENDERSAAALPLLSGKLLAQLGKSWRVLKDKFPALQVEENQKNIMIYIC